MWIVLATTTVLVLRRVPSSVAGKWPTAAFLDVIAHARHGGPDTLRDTLGFLDDSGSAVVSWFEDHAPCLALLTNVPVSRRHERDALGPLGRVPWL